MLVCFVARNLVARTLGQGNWVKAQEWAASPGGQAAYLGNPVPWSALPTILVIEFLVIAFVEHQCSMEKVTRKKQYPGGAFNLLGYSKDPVKFKEYKIREIENGLVSNLHSFIISVLSSDILVCLLNYGFLLPLSVSGRLALLAFVGCCIQQSARPGTGPLENLATPLADPWHNNISGIIIPTSILP